MNEQEIDRRAHEIADAAMEGARAPMKRAGVSYDQADSIAEGLYASTRRWVEANVAVPDLLGFLKTVKDGVLCYSVRLEYGQQEEGLDDTGMSDDERQLRVIASPAGFLGGLRIVYQGTLAELLALDLFVMPTVLSNPPKREQLEEGPYVLKAGAFCWGEPNVVSRWAEKLVEREEQWRTR